MYKQKPDRVLCYASGVPSANWHTTQIEPAVIIGAEEHAEQGQWSSYAHHTFARLGTPAV